MTDDASYIASIWNVISTPEEWLEQGHYFFEHGHYRAAMECYKNAGQDELVFKARAFAAEKRGDSKVAAVSFEKLGEKEKAAVHYEASGNFEKAYRLWQELQNEENALRCYLQMLEGEGKYAELADLYLQQKDFQKALDFLIKAQRFEKAAEVSLKKLDRQEQAAQYYEKAGSYRQAAALQQKLKNFETAAELYERAEDFRKAETLWKRLKREDRLIPLYQRTRNYSSLLAIYEKTRDFDSAVKILKKMPDRSKLVEEAEKLYEKRKYFPALIRYFIVNDHLGTAKSHFRLKNFSDAGRFFALAGAYHDAGAAYKKAKDHESALSNYLKSSQDKQNNFADAGKMARRVPDATIYKMSKTLFTQKKYEQAAFCYAYLRFFAPAGACHLQVQQPEIAYDYWQRCLSDPDSLGEIASHCISHQQITAGAQFILSQPPQKFARPYYSFWDEPKYPTSLLEMMDLYFGENHNEEELLKWVDILERLRFSTDVRDRKFFYLEKSRNYNRLFSYLYELRYEDKVYFSKLKNEFKQDYKKFAGKIAELAAIKLFFLDKKGEFNRVVEKLELTEKNYELFVHSDHAEKAIDLLLEIGKIESVRWILIDKREFLRLAQIYEAHGIVDSAAHYYGVAGQHEKSAALFEKIGKFHKAGEAHYNAGNYLKAVEAYKKTGRNKSKIAQSYEKLGNWQEALKIWKDLGKAKKVQRCLAKLGYQRELGL
jgi:tetratricopeptide (TPR) repeat protein